jgi:hypothetical protein
MYWESKNIYLKNMKNFVDNKWKSCQFFNSIYYQLLEERCRASELIKDFEMQEKLELNLEIFNSYELLSFK